jgi:hypothetical protein
LCWFGAPLGNNVFSLLFYLCFIPSPEPAFGFLHLLLALMCVKPITYTLVIPICPRSASCSPTIMPYKAAHSRNAAERPKLFVTPPEGSARRRTVHGTAVSSGRSWRIWEQCCLCRADPVPRCAVGVRPDSHHTPPSHIGPAGWSCPPTSFPLGDFCSPINSSDNAIKQYTSQSYVTSRITEIFDVAERKGRQ